MTRFPRLIVSIALLALLAMLTACGGGKTPAPATDTAPAGPDLSAPVPVDPALRTGVLDNGLTWYVRENHKPEQRASLFLVVGAGSVDEDDDQKGLAHMVEHLAFNGTEHFPEHELIDYLESVGMAFGPEINAYTSLDQTVYMLQVPTDDPELLDTGLRILEDWSHRVSFEDGEIDKERGVIIEEWRSGLGASDRMFDKQMAVMFHGSKYAERRTIGDMDVIANHEYDTIRRYYRDWYRPDLQAIIAVGDFDGDAMIARIGEMFGARPMPADPRPRVDEPVPPHDETLYSVVTDPEATRTSVRLLWKHPAQPTATLADWRRDLAIDLGASMLRQRFSEISQQADPPFAMAFGGYRQQTRTMTAFSLMAITQEQKVQQAVQTLMEEAERVRRFGFTEGELDRARTAMLRGLESRTEEIDKTESRRWTFQYVQHFLYGQPVPGPEHQLTMARELLPTITAAEVSAALTALMPEQSRVIVASGPEKEGLTWPSQNDLAHVVAAAAGASLAPYQDAVVDAPLVASTPAPVDVTARSEDAELGTVTWTLANGVTVVVKPTEYKNDEVLVSAYAWGGSSRIADPAELRRMSSGDFIVGRSGVGAFDQVALDKKLTGKRVRVSPQISDVEEGFSGSASPRDLETLCQLVYLYATGPREDAEAFASAQSMMRTWLANRDADPMNAMRDTLQVRAGNNDPRNQPVTLADIDAVDLQASLAFYRDVFSDCDDLTFFFVGNVDPAELEPMTRVWLGNLPASPREDMWTDRSWPLPEGVSEDTVVKGIDPKSNVAMVFQQEADWSPEAEYALDSMIACLRIRLREVIREEMSGTYGVRLRGSFRTIPRGRTRIDVSWGCEPARVDELTAAVWGVIDEMRTDGPGDEVLAKVRETQVREHETDLQENRWWLGQLERHHKRGTDPRAMLQAPGGDTPLTRDMVRDAAQKYLTHDDVVKVVLLPEGSMQ